jgi:hypothetical protein
MTKDTSSKRIAKDIGVDVSRMRKLLSAIEDDPKRYEAFFENPKQDLLEFGIDIERYGSEEMPPDKIEKEIVSMARQAVEQSIMERLRPILEMVAATSFSQSTETSYEYNFDNSSETDYKYESHTGTERGTFSETSTGSATDRDTSFSGLSPSKLADLLHGPLINELAIERMLSQMEKTLDHAVMKIGRF